MMQLRFWGVRGDIAVPGPATLKYGGHTSCVTISDHKNNLCILDAGSGLIPLGQALLQGKFGRGKGKALFLLSYGHWDHTQGIGFFHPFYIRGIDSRFSEPEAMNWTFMTSWNRNSPLPSHHCTRSATWKRGWHSGNLRGNSSPGALFRYNPTSSPPVPVSPTTITHWLTA